MAKYTGDCFICNREIELGWWMFENDLMPFEKRERYAIANPEKALSTEIAAGYGSRFDGEYGTMFICDDCFDDRTDRLVKTGNYMDEWADRCSDPSNFDDEPEMPSLDDDDKMKIWVDISSGSYGNADDIVFIDVDDWTNKEFENLDAMTDDDRSAFAFNISELQRSKNTEV